MSQNYYKGFEDVCKRIKVLKTIGEWTVEERSDRVILRKMKDSLQLPELELIIDDSLGFWMFPPRGS